VLASNSYSNNSAVVGRAYALCLTEMRLAKEGLLEPRETFDGKHSNQYFTETARSHGMAGVADDHVPFLERSN